MFQNQQLYGIRFCTNLSSVIVVVLEDFIYRVQNLFPHIGFYLLYFTLKVHLMRFLVLFVNSKSRFNNCVVLLILNCIQTLELGFLSPGKNRIQTNKQGTTTKTPSIFIQLEVSFFTSLYLVCKTSVTYVINEVIWVKLLHSENLASLRSLCNKYRAERFLEMMIERLGI